MRTTLMTGLLAAALLVLAVSPAMAINPTVCAVRSDLVARLDQRFQEKQRAVGMIGSKAIMELFVSSNGSWTIIVTRLDGKSCIVAAGDSWDSVPVEPGDPV